jgi:hypothetical protein
VRSRAAAGLARAAGWEKVGDYSGSWLDWEKNKGKIEGGRNTTGGNITADVGTMAAAAALGSLCK